MTASRRRWELPSSCFNTSPGRFITNKVLLYKCWSLLVHFHPILVDVPFFKTLNVTKMWIILILTLYISILIFLLSQNTAFSPVFSFVIIIKVNCKNENSHKTQVILQYFFIYCRAHSCNAKKMISGKELELLEGKGRN